MPTDPCVFCEIIAGRAKAAIVHEWDHAIAIIPLKPVTEGHLLVIPKIHVRDFTENPRVSAEAMACASTIAMAPCNIITSAGREATQSVFHLHVHVIPRTASDGLRLPWSAVDAVWDLAEATVRAKVAAEIRQHAQDEVRLQSSWLWHALGEERLIEVADRFAARIAEGKGDET